MCNRYSASKIKEIRALGSRLAPGHNFTKQWHPIYNIPPKSAVPVVLKTAEHPLSVMRWGTWTAEGLLVTLSHQSTSKQQWKGAILRRRCVVLADGFFAWENVGQRKFPHYFSLPARDAFPMAGLWFPANDDQPERCIIVTTEANSLVSPYDDQMPAILNDGDIAEWLSDHPLEPEAITRLCQSYPSENMSRWPGPPEVNRTDFQDPSAIQPWQPKPGTGIGSAG